MVLGIVVLGNRYALVIITHIIFNEIYARHNRYDLKIHLHWLDMTYWHPVYMESLAGHFFSREKNATFSDLPKNRPY